MFGKDKEPEAPYEGQKWEYETVSTKLSAWFNGKKLNELGQQGWELVCLEESFLIFKRKVV